METLVSHGKAGVCARIFITVIDAEDEAMGQEAIQTTMERLRQLFEGADDIDCDLDADITDSSLKYETIEAGEPNPEGPLATDS